MLEEDGETQSIAPVGRSSSIASPQYWSSVRCGCIEGILATAIYTNQHSDVWEAASMLLREHYRSVAVKQLSPNCASFRVQEEPETGLSDWTHEPSGRRKSYIPCPGTSRLTSASPALLS